MTRLPSYATRRGGGNADRDGYETGPHRVRSPPFFSWWIAALGARAVKGSNGAAALRALDSPGPERTLACKRKMA